MTSCSVVITCVVKLYYNPEINNFYLIQTKKPNVDALIGYRSTFKDSTNIFLVAKKKEILEADNCHVTFRCLSVIDVKTFEKAIGIKSTKNIPAINSYMP